MRSFLQLNNYCFARECSIGTFVFRSEIGICIQSICLILHYIVSIIDHKKFHMAQKSKCWIFYVYSLVTILNASLCCNICIERYIYNGWCHFKWHDHLFTSGRCTAQHACQNVFKRGWAVWMGERLVRNCFHTPKEYMLGMFFISNVIRNVIWEEQIIKQISCQIRTLVGG